MLQLIVPISLISPHLFRVRKIHAELLKYLEILSVKSFNTIYMYIYIFAVFQLLMKAKQTSPVIKKKRVKAGHEKTQYAIHLLCFNKYKKDLKNKLWFSRFHPSSKKDHMKVHDCSNDFVSCDDPQAVEAMAAFEEMDSRCVTIAYCVYCKVRKKGFWVKLFILLKLKVTCNEKFEVFFFYS